MDDPYGIQVETACPEWRGPRVIDFMPPAVGACKGRIQVAYHIHHTHIIDAVDIDTGTVGEFVQIERGSVSGNIFSGQVVDFHRFQCPEAAYLHRILRKRNGRKAHKMPAVAAHFHKSQLQVIATAGLGFKAVFKHGKIGPRAIGYGPGKSQDSAAAVAQAHHILSAAGFAHCLFRRAEKSAV